MLKDKVYCRSGWNLAVNQSRAIFRHWPPGSTQTHTHTHTLSQGFLAGLMCFDILVFGPVFFSQRFYNASDWTLLLKTGPRSISLKFNPKIVHVWKFLNKLILLLKSARSSYRELGLGKRLYLCNFFCCFFCLLPHSVLSNPRCGGILQTEVKIIVTKMLSVMNHTASSFKSLCWAFVILKAGNQS